MSTTIDYAKARELMVEQQVRPWDVLDPRVLDVLAAMPREEFVAPAHRNLAYADIALPLAHGESMMKPVMEGRTLQSLALDPLKVRRIAVRGRLAHGVYAKDVILEIIRRLGVPLRAPV